MNAPHSVEDRLTRALGQVADGAAGQVDLDVVRRRSRGLAWRRRAAAGGAALALVAIVPGALALHDADRTPAPAPTPAARPHGPVDPAAVPAGPEPEVTWLLGKDVHDGDTVTRLPDLAPVTEISRYQSGWLATAKAQALVQRLDARGAVVSQTPTAYGIVHDADGSHTAFVWGDAVHVGPTDGRPQDEVSYPVDDGATTTPIGFLKDGSVLVTSNQGTLLLRNGVVEHPPIQFPLLLADDRVGLIAGYMRGSAIVTDASGHELWSRDAAQVIGFAPATGSLPARAMVLDMTTSGLVRLTLADARTGATLTRVVLAAGYDHVTPRPAVEPDGSVLWPVADQRDGAVLRISPKGAVTRAGDVLTRAQALSFRFVG